MLVNSSYTLDHLVDLYFAQRQINKKKYFASYLINASLAWKQLFRNTIYAVQTEWVPLKRGTPYNYVDIPKGSIRFFSASEVDRHGQIVPLYYDSLLNIIPKPTDKKCGCNQCDCSGLCDDLNSVVYTTKLLFTINGVDYYEKDWVKYCKNGDIIEYREVPTKKYNDFSGDGGDYNDDYNDDYSTQPPPFSDYTIVTETFQKVICTLKVKPCGCPESIPENEEKVNGCCASFFPLFGHRHRHHYESFLGDINSNHRGSVKMSECGTKLYYKQPIHHGHRGHEHKLPDYLLISYQLSGEDCNTSVQVPELAEETMFFGIDYYSKRFNMSFTRPEREEAKYAWNDAQNKLLLELNPISLEWLSNIQDAVIRY